MKTLLMTLALMAAILDDVRGHGRLMNPAGRSSMWRKGFQGVPIDFNDNQLFCGGFATQTKNGGKCGVCGDPYTGPYDHQLGGKYYTDAIAGTYTPGQVFTAQVELTASHKGWFEFRLCASASKTQAATKACFDQNLLTMGDGRTTRYPVTKSGPAFHDVSLHLPAGVSCNYCVLQWRYHTGNSWGTDAAGKSCIGCGAQEEFYSCANIAITTTGAVRPTPAGPATPTPVSSKPWSPGASVSPSPGPPTSTGGTGGTDGCQAVGEYKKQPGMDAWCSTNCKAGQCPTSHCTCDATSKRQVRELTSAINRAEVYQMLRELLKKAVAGEDI